MEVQSLMEAIVILVFAFNTVMVVALCVAFRNLSGLVDVQWERIVSLCKATGVSYLGLWEGVRKDMIQKPQEEPARKSKSGRGKRGPSTRKVA